MNTIGTVGSKLLALVVPTTEAAAASEGTQAYWCVSPGACSSNWDLVYCDATACYWVGCCV